MPISGNYDIFPPGTCSHKPTKRPVKPKPMAELKMGKRPYREGYWGETIPISFGRRKVPGNLVWSSAISKYGNRQFVDLAITFGYNLVPEAELDGTKLISLNVNGKRIWSATGKESGVNPSGSNNTGPGNAASQENSDLPKFSVKFYGGESDQVVDQTIKAAVGEDNAVAFRNMIYVVLRNFPMHKFGIEPGTPPFFEALLVDRFTGGINLYDHIGPSDTDVVDNRIVWDKGRNWLYYFPEDANQVYFRPYNLNTQSRRGYSKNFTNVPANPAEGLIGSSLACDGETGLIAFAWSDVEGIGNWIQVLNPRRQVLGAYYPTDANYNSSDIHPATNNAGQVGHCEWIHAGGNATSGLFLATAPRSGEGSDVNWVSIYKVNPNTLGLSKVKDITFDGEVTGFVSTQENRLDGFGTLYVFTDDGVGHRIDIYKDATSVNSDGTVKIKNIGTLCTPDDGHGTSGVYDPTDNKLYVSYFSVDEEIDRLIKFSLPIQSPASGDREGIIEFTGAIADTYQKCNRFLRGCDVSDGYLFYQGSAEEFWIVNLSKFTFNDPDDVWSTGTLVPIDDQGNPETANMIFGSYWNGKKKVIIAPKAGTTSFDSGPCIIWPQFSEYEDGNGIDVGDVLTWLLKYAGYTAGEIDTSEVPTSSMFKIYGGAWFSEAQLWDEVGVICDAYNLDKFESAGVFKFVKKDRSTAITADADISSDYLIPIEEQLITRITIQKATDLPTTVEVSYYDPDVGYRQTVQKASRGTEPGTDAATVAGQGTLSFDLPLVLRTGVARSIATRVLYSLWEAQSAIQFTLSKQYLWIEPGDIIGLDIIFQTGDNDTNLWKARDVKVNTDFQVQVTATLLSPEEDYEFPFTASPGFYTEPDFDGAETSEILALDVPNPDPVSLERAQALVTAYSPYPGTNWAGANIYYEDNSSLIYQKNIGEAVAPVILNLETGLAAAQPFVVNDQGIDVSIISGEASRLVSVSLEELLDGANLALVGNDSRGWEYIQFQNVEDNGDGTYFLSNFIRGRRGTEAKSSSAYSEGDIMILMQNRSFAKVDVHADLGTDASLLAVGANVAIEDGTAIDLSVTGESIRPFAPVHPEVSSGTWGSDITVTFKPRNRGAYELPDDEDIADFPYDEDTVSFEVDILDTDATTVLRTLTGITSNSFTYTSANQASDFGTQPEPLYIRMYQISDNATVDRGYSNLEALSIEAGVTITYTIVGYLLNLPLISYSDNDSSVYGAITSDTLPAVTDVFAEYTASSYTDLGNIVAQATPGVTSTDFYDGVTHAFDYANTVRVVLTRGTLSSTTELGAMNGANWAAIENSSGEWEVFAFVNATLVGTRTYDLSTFIRGLRGTEYAMRSPVASGARFILLNSSVVNLPVDDTYIGDTVPFHFGPSTETVPSGDSFVSYNVAMPIVTARPYSPASAEVSLSGSDLVLTWIRRDRKGAEYWDVSDIPMSEDTESYEVDIMDGVSVVRTITASSETATYTSAQQTTDWGGLQTSIDVNIYQISALYGRGTPLSITLSV